MANELGSWGVVADPFVPGLIGPDSFSIFNRMSSPQTQVEAQQVYESAGNPNGVVSVTTTLPCICIDTTNGVLWVKTDGIISNTGWTTP